MNRKAQALCVEAIAQLQKERKRRKLSKYYIAQTSGLSPQMVGYIENGTRNPTLESVLRIAEAMGVKFEDVIKRARKKLPKSVK